MTEAQHVLSFPYVFGEPAWKKYPNVTIGIETITPEVAEDMLYTNIGNRDPKREAIDKAIANGEWTLNGATIVFDENGNLTDGQNRLMACIRTGVPIDTIVVRGIKRSAQITMDTGVKRKLVDYLKLAGYKNCTTVGAMGTAMCYKDLYGLDGVFTHQNSNMVTVKSTFDFINANYAERIEPFVKSVAAVRTSLGVEAKVTGLLFDTFKDAGKENLDEFIGQMLDRRASCESVRMLKVRLRANKESKTGKLPARVVAALIIKAWNAYMRGEDIKHLRFIQGGANPESFPKVFLGYQ